MNPKNLNTILADLRPQDLPTDMTFDIPPIGVRSVRLFAFDCFVLKVYCHANALPQVRIDHRVCTEEQAEALLAHLLASIEERRQKASELLQVVVWENQNAAT